MKNFFPTNSGMKMKRKILFVRQNFPFFGKLLSIVKMENMFKGHAKKYGKRKAFFKFLKVFSFGNFDFSSDRTLFYPIVSAANRVCF